MHTNFPRLVPYAYGTSSNKQPDDDDESDRDNE